MSLVRSGRRKGMMHGARQAELVDIVYKMNDAAREDMRRDIDWVPRLW